MPKDEQDIYEFVTSKLSYDFKKISDVSNEIAEKFDRAFNQTADALRQGVQNTGWIPESVKPPPPPRRVPVSPPAGVFGSIHGWIDRHRALTAAVIAFVGTGTFLIWRRRKHYSRKRRARRAMNGAKTEVVILAGSPYSDLTRSIALDLERRGFIVYIPVGSLDEETKIANMHVSDIRSLNFDITSSESTTEMIEKMKDFFEHPHRNGTPHLHFASLILLDSYPSTHLTGPISSLSTPLWFDTLSAHVLYPIALTTTFLPLLLSPPALSTTSSLPTILLLTSSTVPSLHPAGHATESLSVAAVTSFLTTLRAELPTSVKTTHIRLGSLYSSQSLTGAACEELALTRTARLTPSSSSSQSPSSSPALKTRTTPALRELHNEIFDAATGRISGTIFVGRGARTYALVGAWAPAGLIGWLTHLALGNEEGKAPGRGRESHSRSQPVRRGSDDSVGGVAGSAEWEKVDEV